MPVNASGFAAQSVYEIRDVVIEMLNIPPDVNAVLPQRQPPGKLVGFYNGSTDSVELYVVNAAGAKYIRVS